jgi:hypothetical protein
MADVVLGVINEADAQTGINSHNDFLGSNSVFLVNGGTAGVANKLDGIESVGNNGGAGVAGRGGKPWPHMEPPEGKLQSTRVRAAGPGVIGYGGPVDDNNLPGLPGPGVIGLGTSANLPYPQYSAGVGVYGAGTIGVIGVAGGGGPNQFSSGTGVIGVCGEPLLVLDPKYTSDVGVCGASDRGTGVYGLAGGPIEPGVRGEAGVVGVSGNGPGGSFESSQMAQLHLTPSQSDTLPTVGLRGDLWVHVAKNSPKGTRFREGTVSIYVCVEDIPEVRWQKVLLDTAKLAGGSKVP